MKKSEFFNSVSVDRVEIPVPGRPGDLLIFSKSASNNVKWPFVTPRFARWLLTHTTKPVSKQLVDFYFEVHDAARRLKQAIDAGYVTLKRKILDPEEALERPDKRLKTAAASAALMSMTIDKVDGTGKTMVCNRYLGPRIHDALNVAICGHTRNEISVGLNFRKVNVSDHDTPEQELWKAALKSRLRKQIVAKQLRNDPVNARVVLDLNQKNLHGMHELLPEIQDDGIVTERMTVDDAKATRCRAF